MNIPTRYMVTAAVFFAAFFAYNAFLIQRDSKLFESYYGTTQEQLK